MKITLPQEVFKNLKEMETDDYLGYQDWERRMEEENPTMEAIFTAFESVPTPCPKVIDLELPEDAIEYIKGDILDMHDRAEESRDRKEIEIIRNLLIALEWVQEVDLKSRHVSGKKYWFKHLGRYWA